MNSEECKVQSERRLSPVQSHGSRSRDTLAECGLEAGAPLKNYGRRGDRPLHRGEHKLALHYRVGDVDISVQSDYAEALDDFEHLYGAFRTDRPSEHAIVMQAKADERSLFGRRRYSIHGDGVRIFGARKATEVFPYLEWGINWRVVKRRRQFLLLHAAALTRDGRTMMFAGNSGCGKSTLAAVLLSRGWEYLGDEFAMIDPTTFEAHPFPKALCLKFGSFDIARRLNLTLFRRKHYSKDFKGPVGYVDPRADGGAAATTPRAIDCIVFPRFEPDQTPELQTMPRAAAAFELARCTFNPADFGERLMPLLCEFTRRGECMRMASGGVDETADMLETHAAANSNSVLVHD